MIDYLTLMLLNMTAGLILLGIYMGWGLLWSDHKLWSPAFAAVGAVAIFSGAHMTLTWPLPGQFNTAFGEMSVLFGVAYLAAALAVGKGWSLVGVAIYGALGGLGAVVVGVRCLHLHLTALPALTAAGYILTGLSSFFVLAALAARAARGLRILAAAGLFLSAGIWGFTGYSAVWMHLESQAKWKPAAMRAAAPPPAATPATDTSK